MKSITKILENYLIKKEKKHKIWKIHRTKDFLKHSLYYSLPHIIITLILIFFFPQKWFGILILGIFLSDFFYFIKPFIRIVIGKNNSWVNNIVRKEYSLFSHTVLLSASIILLLSQEYIISLSGFIHFLMDRIGF